MDLDSLTSASFFVVAAALLVLERIPAFRRAATPVQQRLLTNIGLFLLSGILVTLLYPISILEVADQVEGGPLGYLSSSLFVQVPLVFLLMDFWRYWEHRILHEVSPLWRLHLVHHSDTAVDTTTSVRHHPLEGIITSGVVYLLVFALGFTAQAIGIYLLVALLSSLYTHANVVLPPSLDRILRRFLVTPAVHAVHHSDYQPETDSNYGGVLTIWDRLFGTYTSPESPTSANFGLEYFRSREDAGLGPALLQPFEYHRGPYPDYPDENNSKAEQEGPDLTPQWHKALRYAAVGVALVLLVMSYTVYNMVSQWIGHEAYQYAWLVTPVFIYMVAFRHRERLLALTPQTASGGLHLVLLAACLWLIALLMAFNVGQQLALVLAIHGVVIWSLGRAIYRAILPAMMLLFLMIPSGDLFLPILHELTVKWLQWFSLLMGLPYQIDGNLVSIGQQRYAVVEACAGLTFFTLGGFLGYTFGLLLYRSFAKVLALAVIGAALGILTNAARVCLIVGIDWINSSQMDLAAHQDLQWVALLACLSLVLFLASRLDHESEWPSEH